MPGAASTDYMHLFGLVALSYMWARMVKAVLARQAAGTSTPALDAKLWLARFFNARVMPEAAAHVARIGSGVRAFDGTGGSKGFKKAFSEAPLIRPSATFSREGEKGVNPETCRCSGDAER